VAGNRHFGPNLRNMAAWADQESGAHGSHEFSPVYDVFCCRAIGFEHLMGLVGCRRDGERRKAVAEPPETARKAGFLAMCLPFDAFGSEFFG